MGRRLDHTGVEQTCPYIDKVVSLFDTLTTSWLEDMPDGFDKDAANALKTLETIRQMNADLRDFGIRKVEELQEMEKDRDYYRDQYEKAKNEAEAYAEEARSLEKTLSQYE